MADTFPFPLEVLRLILRNLAMKDELSTLATLLRVSKHVALATLPYIYEDPFTWLNPYHFGHSIHPRKDIYDRLPALVQLLLRDVPEQSCTGLVAAMYDFEPGLIMPQSWPINYLSYLRRFNSVSGRSSLLLNLPNFTPARPALKQYIVEHQLDEKYTSLAIGKYHGHCTAWPYASLESRNTLDFLTQDIHRELTWIICSPFLEQLQSIVIPLTDISRYLDSVSRFSSLELVTFQLDGIAQMIDEEDLRDGDQEKLNQRMAQRLKDLESAVQFIQTHTVLFRGCLRQVFVPEDAFRGLYPQICPESYLRQMLESLPSLINPTEITDTNWEQFVGKSEQTDVTHVHSIIVHECTGPWYQQLKSRPSFLHRCRSLKEYRMVSLGPESFKSIGHDYCPGSGRDTQVADEGPLPFLEHVSILAYNEPFGSELDDIGRACGKTLRFLHIEGHQGLPGDITIPPVRIGNGWRMPLISKLLVKMGSEKLVVDPYFLRHSPSLEILSLVDNQMTYVLNEIEISLPVLLPNLTRLRLYGTPALSFHPDTFHSTKKLEILVLGTPETYDRHHSSMHLQDYTAPQPFHSDYEDSTGAMFSFPRPQWTWDWDLPSLVRLDLSVGFALHFHFQMLHGCPSLEELFLNIFSEQGRVERVLTLADFTLDVTATNAGHQAVRTDPTTQEIYEAICLHTLTRRELLEIQQRFIYDRPRTEPLPFSPFFQRPSIPREVQRQREEEMGRNFMFGRRGQHNHIFSPQGGYVATPSPSPFQLQPCNEIIQNLEDQLAQEPAILQPILDIFLEKKRAIQEKERKEVESQRQFRLAHPECLTVPSLRKLEMHGHWILSEEVLEFMLWRVFRNIERIVAHQWEGFEDEAWLRITGEMPRLKAINQV
ncbi:MAG: hypothetical protein BYD32DRAFT_417598 [Podila humilis]|nr:MAG: hypothetical protein BYD32DRAFT_417598 [Podila humilis]